jgi:hypothetical protein
MKDARGHGSDAHDPQHQAARAVIKLHPNDFHPEAERILFSRGYSPSDIGRLRLNAGAVYAGPMGHQAAVQRVPNQSLYPSRPTRKSTPAERAAIYKN